MTMTPAEQRAIIEQESAWTDNAFGQLDLSAFPALNELPPEDKHDDRFSKDWRDTPFNASASALRHFVSDPDAEALAQIAVETGNEDIARDLRDRRGERVVLEFKQRNPDYLPTDANYRSLTMTLAFNALPPSEQNADPDILVDRLIESGHWTAANLEACYLALNREGLLDRPAGEPRNLTERERLRVARLAQAGRIDEAIGEYLRCALDGDEPGMDLINDPKYRTLCGDAVYEVFQNIQLDYVETASRKAYLLRFAGTRPLTVRLLEQAWKNCQAQEQRHERSQLLGQVERPQEAPPMSAKEIDALGDAEVDRLYHDSLRAWANSARRGPGVLQ